MYTANPSHTLVFAPEKSALRSVSGAIAYTLLRVAVGVIMAAHGTQKLLDLDTFREQVSALGIPVPAVAAPLAMAGELFGGLGLVVGLLTPLAAFGVLATMLTAIASVHIEHGLFAQDHGFEYPLLIAAVALCFMINGAGPFSLDAALAQGGKKRRPEVWPLARRGLPFDPSEPRPSGHVPSDGPIDEVTRAGMESFPASDPPAHSGRG